ncbi:MAG: DUF3488 domain-containing transglutaminase family protein, partial [Bdellovibrionaceae bacterium]|nr:DUF3488 domain-containing transglutaminase family protein [Pseudobdellovibrionaceae bacterium]
MIHPSRYFLFVTFALLPHLLMFPLDVTAIIILLISWSAFFCYKNILRPSKWVLRAITISTALVAYLRYGSLANPDAATAVICMIIILKLFETQSYRDAMALLLMSLIVVMSYLIHSYSLLATLYMLIVFILSVYFMMELQRKKYFLKQNSVRWSDLFSLEMVVALPLLVGLFVFFPRFTTRFGSGERVVQTIGFSDQIQLGQLIQLSQSTEVAFKVRFLNQTQFNYSSLYFRGAVLTNSKKMAWKKSTATTDFVQNLDSSTTPEYQIILSPRQQKNLFTLEKAVIQNVSPQLFLFTKKNENIFFTNSPIEQNISYYVSTSKNPVPDHFTQEEIATNSPTDESLKNIAQSLQAQTTEEKVENILLYFKNNGFTYSTEVPGYKSIDEFFKNKVGFCEHYASGFVTLARLMNIPSRIVVGFMGGEINPFDDSITVRDKFAHAWAEVYSEKRGWYRVDPTAVINPGRLVNTTYAQTSSQKLYENIFANSTLFLESLNNKFELFLLNFNSESQLGIISQMGQYFRFQYIVFFLGIPMFFILLIAIIWWIWRLDFKKRDPLTLAFELLLKKISR